MNIIFNFMENINPKNFIDIDPTAVSFITLKNGNMIVIDELTPAKPNKKKIVFEEEEKNNDENIDKPKQLELFLSEQFNLSFIGNQKKEDPTTIIKKSDFNLISSITKNINFSIINKNNNTQKNNNKQNANFNQNFPSPNSSIDIKSSMFQSRRDNLNINNITNTNNNILSEDNVNIHLTDTIMSNQINHNNGKNNERVMSLNTLMTNMTENNLNNLNNKNNKLNKANNIILDTQKYTFDDTNNDNGKNINKEDNIINNNQNLLNNPNEINLNNNGFMNNFNSINNNEQKDKIPNLNNPSLIMQNNNFYSQNNFPINNINLNEPNKNNLTEAQINNSNENDIRSSKKYKRLNRLRGKKRDKNYIKAVVSLNIPGEEQEGINLVKQFNLLVDRLNGQKSHTQAKENIKRSDRYYELYKNNNDNIINSFLSPGKSKKLIQTNSFFDISNITYNTKLGDINNSSNIYNNDVSIISNKKNNFNDLNSRILALKERTFNSLNNSFRNDNIKDNNNNIINNSEIVLPSNFAYRK